MRKVASRNDPAARLRAALPVAIPLAVVALLLILLGLMLRQEFDRGRELRASVDQSYRNRAQLQTVLSLHQDVETGQRGYIITGDRRFLEPYERAEDNVARELNALAGEARSNPVLAATVARLRRLSTEKLVFVRNTILAREQGRIMDAVRQVAGGQGKAVMDQIRGEIERLDRFERERLAERTRRADEARRNAQRLTFLLEGLLLLLLIGAALIIARTMAARRRALDRFEDLSTRRRAILESAKDGIITLNPSGSIEDLNHSAARMYGYTPEELLRRDVGTLFEVAPDRGQIETFLKRLRLSRDATAGRIEEFWGRRKDGSTFPSEVAVSPMELSNGTHFVAIIRDVTERKQVEQMKSEFVSTVSHELRTPLTSIAGSLGLLTGGAAGALPERAQRLVEIARSNCERLVRLINDILDIEKIESGKMAFDLRPVPLHPFLEQAVQANLGFAAQHKVALKLVPAEEEATVVADPDRLMQAVTNLISNAIKFSPEAGVVVLSVEPLERRYRINVTDRGSGIPEEFKQRIFGKFAQADSSDTRQKGGTGLGLSIVREIVTRMGGAVSFVSSRGAGTVFHIDLPAPIAAPELRVSAGSADLPCILHVDDDPDVLRVVASAFEDKAKVRAAASLEEARAAVHEGGLDLVILDIGLADGSGLDLLQDLRQDGKPRVPVIVFTAQDSDPAFAWQADAVLTKSRARLDQLVDTAAAFLGRETAQ